jgi:hypothetical protein
MLYSCCTHTVLILYSYCTQRAVSLLPSAVFNPLDDERELEVYCTLHTLHTLYSCYIVQLEAFTCIHGSNHPELKALLSGERKALLAAEIEEEKADQCEQVSGLTDPSVSGLTDTSVVSRLTDTSVVSSRVSRLPV